MLVRKNMCTMAVRERFMSERGTMCPRSKSHQGAGAPGVALTPARTFSANYAVRSKDQRLWQRDSERSCGLEIDDELESRGLLHG